MCFTVAANIVREEMERRFGARFTDPSWFKAGYLFSAFRLPVLPVITSDDPVSIIPARWGLVPAWVKTTKEAEKIRFKTFNARAETLFEKPAFRKAASAHRCLVPVSGFFEWHNAEAGKIPFYLYRKDQTAFALAGIYEEWVNRNTGEIEPTFSVVTTRANALLEKIHNIKKRMPLILSGEIEQHWLDPAIPTVQVRDILLKTEAPDLAYHPVSTKISGPETSPWDASVIQRVDYGIDPFQHDLFSSDNH